MARLRKFVAYRRLERPFTRFSKYKVKNYVRARPNIVIPKFEAGNVQKQFELQLDLVAQDNLQIRHNALESARMTTNRLLESMLGKDGFHSKLKSYPHHILRENPLASGAGADRLSTGMKQSFGKSISRAARVFEGKVIISIRINKCDLAVGRKALKRASKKIPGSYIIQEKKL